MRHLLSLHPTWRLALLCLAALLPLAAPAAGRDLAGAQALAPLPGGAWLALMPRELQLVDADGATRARLPMRAEALDARPRPGGALAVVIDADTQRTLRLDIDLTAMTMAAAPLLDSPPYTVEALCLYRDAQGLDHVFLVGDEGLAEQWLIAPAGPPRSVRVLALPPGIETCRVDDAAGLLYVIEPGLGVWAYGAEAEGPLERQAVALRQPFGPLDGGAAAIAVLPGGLAVMEASGRELYLLERRPGPKWQRLHRLRVDAGEVEQLVARDGGRRLQLAWPDEDGRGWKRQSIDWSRQAQAGLPAVLPIVRPRVQTEPVPRAGDAADDPAIWIHPGDAARSRVLGTNKKLGLHVYDLSGHELQRLEVGRLNNVDVRQRVRLGDRERDLAAATHRDELALVLFEFDAEGQLREAGRVPTGLEDIYGVCLHRPRAGGLEAFVNDKDGRFVRIRVEPDGERLAGRVVQRFSVGSQPEACVADDEAERLFLGEEDRAVWTMSLAPAAGLGSEPRLQQVLGVGGPLQADVEGLALVDGRAGRYLIVSSQGNHSYLVLDAQPPFALRGAFRVGLEPALGIDGVSETDGLDATSTPLGPAFPGGLLVLQDGFKRMPSGPQNFKYVAWDDVLRALGLSP